MKTKLLPIIIAILSFSAFSQYNRYPVKNYTSADFGKDLEPKIWCVASDSRDVMYFGASNNVLQFDGKIWNRIFVKSSTWVTSLAVSKNGVVFVGGNHEFGFLSPNSKGLLKYHSISERLTDANMVFGVIWKIHILNESVYFQADEKIFVYKNGIVETIEPSTSFHLSFMTGNRLFVVERERGMREIINNNLVNIDPDGIFKDKGAFSMLMGKNGESFIFTADYGFWSFNPISEIVSEQTEFLKSFSIYGAIKLNDGNFAINTLDNGLIITDQNLNVESVTNNTNGLLVNGVMQSLQDRFGNIWLATDNGISLVEYTSQFSYFNNTGITGNINDIINFGNKFIVATSDGLFIQNDLKKNEFEIVFKRHDLIKNAVRSLELAGDELIIGTEEGVYSFKDNNLQEIISGINGFDICFSPKTNLLFIGGTQGLNAYAKKITWGKVMAFDDILSDLKSLLLIEKENKTIEVWAGTLNDGLYRVVVNPDNETITYQYTDFNLLPSGWVKPFIIDNNILVGSGFGIYSYSEEEIDEGLTDLFFERIPFANSSENSGFVLMSDLDDYVFSYIDNMPGVYNKQTGIIDSISFMDFYIGRINFFYNETDSITWMGGNDGLARFSQFKKKDFQIPFKAIINEVSSNKKILFSGIFFETDIQGPDSLFMMNLKQTKSFIPVLNYEDNTITFGFSAPYFEGIDKTQFSYKLDGYSKDFCEWTGDTKITFHNLREGKYRFVLKSRNVYGLETEEVSYEFEILPPWYRTIWAYVLYVLGGIILIFVIVRLYSYKLKQENRKLERIVKERTFEIEQQKEEITTQRDEIEEQHEIVTKQKDAIEEMHEELKDSINYAERIQSAILPPKTILESGFAEHFILFMPRDIVSGDFYWATEIENKFIIAVADCTGHGVPGAFMSMLGTAFLNEVINKEKNTDSATILNLLRQEVMKALKQEQIREMQMKDGMDMSLIVYDKTSGMVQFSGANNSVYIIAESELKLKNPEDIKRCSFLDESLPDVNAKLFEIKADKMPIAVYERMDSFTSVSFAYQPGMCIYLFTDGFADQFGGPFPNGKKYKYKTFKRLMLSANNDSLNNQKELLISTYNKWTDHVDELTNKTFEQIDDICIVGLKF